MSAKNKLAELLTELNNLTYGWENQKEPVIIDDMYGEGINEAYETCISDLRQMVKEYEKN